MRLQVRETLNVVVGELQDSQEPETKANPEVCQPAGVAADVLDVPDILENLLVHKEQLIVTQIQVFELVKLVEYSGSEFPDVVVIK